MIIIILLIWDHHSALIPSQAQDKSAFRLWITPPLSNSIPSRKIQDSKEPTSSTLSHLFSCDSIYDIPSTFRKSGTSLGYGKKSDFTKDLTSSPGSTKYCINTLFDKNVKQKKGFSLYESRDVHNIFIQKIPDRGHIPLDPLKVPGPTKYQNLKANKGLTYTMRKRLPTIDRTMSIDSQNINPGAGRY